MALGGSSAGSMGVARVHLSTTVSPSPPPLPPPQAEGAYSNPTLAHTLTTLIVSSYMSANPVQCIIHRTSVVHISSCQPRTQSHTHTCIHPYVHTLILRTHMRTYTHAHTQGCVVEVQMQNGVVYEGVLRAISPNMEIALSVAHVKGQVSHVPCGWAE